MQLTDVQGVTRANAYMVPVEELHEGKHSRRWADQDVLELALSIADQGQLVPILVKWAKNGEGQEVLEIVEGHRRAAAIRYINDNGLIVDGPLKVRAEIYRGGEAFSASASANLNRKGLTAIDLAHCITTLEAEGKSRKEIAKLLGISEALISRTLKLLTLPAALQRDIHKGKISAEAGYELADSTPEEREEVLATSREQAKEGGKEEAKAAAGGKVTRTQVRKAKRTRAERGEETSGPKAMSRKEFRKVFEDFAACDDGTIEEPIQKLCKTILDLIDGKAGERAVLNRMRELGDSK